MKRLLLLSLIIFSFLFISILPVKAETEFEMHMNDFYKQQKLASELLKEIERDLKNGSREKVCIRQKKAANYGIQATESLMKAFSISGSISQMENIQAGLNRWKELRDYC